jgi:hypothetical protein
MQWLIIGDYFLFIFHLLFVVFILTGWIVKPLRRLHLIAILLTFLSWFGLGMIYGWGFCILTEWHWQILRQLGHWDMPSSYVAYLLQRAFGLIVDESIVDTVTVASAFAAFLVSLWVNFVRKKR